MYIYVCIYGHHPREKNPKQNIMCIYNYICHKKQETKHIVGKKHSFLVNTNGNVVLGGSGGGEL